MNEYIQFVVDEAKKLNKQFFLDSGEGRDYEDPKTGWYIEDLSGWLFDLNDEDTIKRFIITQGSVYFEGYKENYIFVKWEINELGNIEIQFITSDLYKV